MLPLFYAVGTSGHFPNDGAKVIKLVAKNKFFNQKMQKKFVF